MKRLRLFAVVSALAALVAVPSAYAAGLWWGLPLLGGAAYCVSGTSVTTGCLQAPAGPTVFTGREQVPADIVSNTDRTPSSVYMSVLQLGNGALSNQTVVGLTQTIPDYTPWYIIGGAQGGAFTVTMPPNPIEGQIQHVLCASATGGTMTVVANTGQTVNTGVAATCAVGAGYAWRYTLASTTWIRFQ